MSVTSVIWFVAVCSPRFVYLGNTGVCYLWYS